ncbi:hypothetical protein MHK_010239, partial [Candidatus Magnetomorum sp. HK-1]
MDYGNHRIQTFQKKHSNTTNKLLIIAGGGPFPGNKLWDATQFCAYLAYRVALYRGFIKDETVMISSPYTEVDLDGNQVCDDIIEANTKNLQQLFLSWVKEVDNLYIYIVNHGGYEQLM